MEGTLGIPAFVTGIILAAVVGLVIIGGIKRIGDVAGKVCTLYDCALCGNGFVRYSGQYHGIG